MDYAKDSSHGDFVFDTIHLRSYGKVNQLQLANIFLHQETLNVGRNPSILRLGNTSWEAFKKRTIDVNNSRPGI